MPAAPGRPLVEMLEVSMEFAARDGTIHAVDRVSLSVPEGDFVCVVGPSGCGKTTLLRVIAGFVAPTAGQAVLDGVTIAGPDRPAGVVFQQPTLYPLAHRPPERRVRAEDARHRDRATAGSWPSATSGWSAWEFRDKAPLRAVGRDAAARGDRPRACQRPAILLMDEPFGALDALTREHMQEELLRIWLAHAEDRLLHHPQRRGGRLPRHDGRRHVAAARPHPVHDRGPLQPPGRHQR